MKEKTVYFSLLKKFCDGLIALQDTSSDPAFRGGIRCRSCKTIHGRCPDGVFAFVELYKLTGEKKYLDAGLDVFAYGDNLLCEDGGLYNDAQTTWRYTTTFHLIAVVEAYLAGQEILPQDAKEKFRDRIVRMAEWLYRNLDEKSPANINYSTTNGLALALAGKFLGNADYLRQAKHLTDYAMAHFTENGFLYGESKPHDKKSALGLYGIDLGYNAEESVPALVKYACLVGDEGMKDKLSKVLARQAEFLFPDGGWDNSFGNRNNKWTYWGSRTSDGCAPAYLLLADRDPSFAEVALRNTLLLERCTEGGLLYGGPHYRRHGEYACSHHTFEHANALAYALENIDEKYLAPERVSLPSEGKSFLRYYPEIHTYKMSEGEYSATVTGYDFDIAFSGHASGGTLTALYSRRVGPMVMASVNEYILVEPTNMQQVKDIEHHRPLTPRLSAERGGKLCQSCFFAQMQMCADEAARRVCVQTGLADRTGKVLEGAQPEIVYTLRREGLEIGIRKAFSMQFILPLIAGSARVLEGTLVRREPIFFLTGGFMADELTIEPSPEGNLRIFISSDADENGGEADRAHV